MIGTSEPIGDRSLKPQAHGRDNDRGRRPRKSQKWRASGIPRMPKRILPTTPDSQTSTRRPRCVFFSLCPPASLLLIGIDYTSRMLGKLLQLRNCSADLSLSQSRQVDRASPQQAEREQAPNSALKLVFSLWASTNLCTNAARRARILEVLCQTSCDVL